MPQNLHRNAVLIIRFSSFGDVTQALSIPSVINRNLPTAEVHWVVRSDLAPLLEGHPHLHKVWSYDRKLGFGGLLRLGWQLRRVNFSYVYDAHNNLRSRVLSFFTAFATGAKFVRKSQFRWKRFLLFKLRINTYQMPFSGQRDLLSPLQAWSWNTQLPEAPQLFVNKNESFASGNYIALAPSAAHPLKRWPLEHWKQLIALLPAQNFKVLGGSGEDFLFALQDFAPNRVQVYAGKMSLKQSALVIQQSQLVISNDTGLLHIAEQLGRPTLALMGPAPFGYPSRPTTEIIELHLPCKPCSKHGQGPCINANFHQCLKGISPELVSARALEKLSPV